MMYGDDAMGMRTQQVNFDTAETVYISGMALLKMLKHGKSGIPLEVVGLMLGRFIDNYTVQVVDVFPTPQSGTGTSVEAIDEPYQASMTEMLKLVGRKEDVVGWYHSHPGFGVWLSNVDINQQLYWEKLNPRCIAVVVDPVQSVRGKVIIGAFRCISQNQLSLQAPSEPRETTSFIGSLEKPSIKALVRGLNRLYYQMPVAYRMSNYEQQMLMSLNRPTWSSGFEIPNFVEKEKKNIAKIKKMSECADTYRRCIIEEEGMSESELITRHVGKVDPKQFMKENSDEIAANESSQLVRLSVDATAF